LEKRVLWRRGLGHETGFDQRRITRVEKVNEESMMALGAYLGGGERGRRGHSGWRRNSSSGLRKSLEVALVGRDKYLATYRYGRRERGRREQ
jgi:hypothetical protein